jgi:hypothetical protein
MEDILDESISHNAKIKDIKEKINADIALENARIKFSLERIKTARSL